MHGQAPEITFTVNGKQYKMGYYLADGIYPDWKIFIKTILEPQGAKHQLFAKQQEAEQKDVEQAFGILQV